MCLIKHYAMKMYWVSGKQLHAFLILELDECEWSASLSGHFTPEEKALGTHWIGGWVGPRASLDVVTKEKNPITALHGN
jgi:hypothetical protein